MVRHPWLQPDCRSFPVALDAAPDWTHREVKPLSDKIDGLDHAIWITRQQELTRRGNETSNLGKEGHLFVCGSGRCCTPLIELPSRARGGFLEGAVVEIDHLIDQIDQSLVQQHQQDWIAPLLGHALQGLIGRPPTHLSQKLPAIRIQNTQIPLVDPQLAQVFDLLQFALDGAGILAAGPFAEPCKEGATSGVLRRQKVIELGSTRRGQQRLQQTECLRLSLLAGRAHQPHQTIARRANDSLRPKAIAGEPQKENRFIVFERSVEEPLQQPLVVLGGAAGGSPGVPEPPQGGRSASVLVHRTSQARTS